MFFFSHRCLGKLSNLTNILQIGWITQTNQWKAGKFLTYFKGTRRRAVSSRKSTTVSHLRTAALHRIAKASDHHEVGVLNVGFIGCKDKWQMEIQRVASCFFGSWCLCQALNIANMSAMFCPFVVVLMASMPFARWRVMNAWDHWLQKQQVPIGFNEKKPRGSGIWS